MKVLTFFNMCEQMLTIGLSGDNLFTISSWRVLWSYISSKPDVAILYIYFAWMRKIKVLAESLNQITNYPITKGMLMLLESFVRIKHFLSQNVSNLETD